MKANAPKRKVFRDAVDFLTEDLAAEKAAVENGILQLEIEKIEPFYDHPFRLYEGERLEDMIQSIREHGVLNPVIVRRVAGKYEMLAGHNRMNAARLAGLTEIPAIVKADLSDEDAYVYVIETNVIQRGFAELLPSEKAAVLAERHNKVSCQGKRNDILQEIEKLEYGSQESTSGHSDQKLWSRESIAREYDLSGSSVARLLRINKLIPEFKEQLDVGSLPFMVAVNLSSLPEVEQKVVDNLAKQGRIKLNAKNVKEMKEQAGQLTAEKVAEICSGKKTQGRSASKGIMIPSELYERYFSGMKAADVDSILEQALEAWFGRGGGWSECFGLMI